MSIEPVSPADEKKSNRLTGKQWAEIEALWECGEVTIEDLAAKYGKSKTCFTRHFSKHKIMKGSKLRKAAIKESVAASVNDESVIAKRIKETKDDHYKMAAALGKLTWAEIMKARADKIPYSAIKDNLKALESAANILMKTRMERFAVLGLDKENHMDSDELPELLISELTAEQIEEMRKRRDEGDDLDDLDDLGVNVDAVQVPEPSDHTNDVGDDADMDDIVEEGDDEDED